MYATVSVLPSWRVRVPAVVWLAAACALGCSSARRSPADAAPDAPVCNHDGPICDGNVVRVCMGGTLAAAGENCADEQKVCSLGRCTSQDCFTAETKRTSLTGCLFYTIDLDNVASDADLPVSFLVANASDNDATVELQRPTVGADADAGDAGVGGWSTLPGQLTAVLPGAAGRLSLAGAEVKLIGAVLGGGLRLSSDEPITVEQIQSDDGDQAGTTSSGGTFVLPVQLLGQAYAAMTYPQAGTGVPMSTSSSPDGAGRIVIVATRQATTVTFTPSATTVISAAPPSAPTNATSLGQQVTPNSPFMTVLNDGDVFQIISTVDGSDLSGSTVTADAPVAVFSGNLTTTYGKTPTGLSSPDLAYEQMPPLHAWDMSYVAAAVSPPSSDMCHSFFSAGYASLWRVLAATDRTTVTFQAPAGVTTDLTTSSVTLNAGQALDTVVSGGSLLIMASFPILVTQGMDCEPSLSLAIGADGLLSDPLPFSVLPNFDQLLVVVRDPNDEVDLDGIKIDDPELAGTVSSSDPGNQFQVVSIPMPVCPGSRGVCAHLLTAPAGGKFGMTLRGMDVNASYVLTAPGLLGCGGAGCVD